MEQTEKFKKQLKHYRLSASEYDLIVGLLGRPPQGIEWALFSALWSEHCSYKSSRRHLKKFFFESPRVLESFGENAGVIDLGEGERVAFKMESHNHPSFIEPFQGAATGVGGILRDIFTMGARPVALADYLCFGEPEAPRMSSLVDGVVKGISHYGNCVGVPTITGQTEFHKSYNGNILVNAMAVGLFRPGEPVVNSKARGEGNWVVYVGAKTGKDGVHGASMASESFDEQSESKKPTVQIGDPFFEKLLIESCLEVMQKNLVVAIQDMGAAGLTSSSFEMAAKGDVGFDVHLDKIPLRDPSVTPEEILLSESQERMLLICEPKRYEEIVKVFERWGLDAVKIGEVKKERKVSLFWKGDLLTAMDPHLLTENAPMYDRAHSPWTAKYRVQDLGEKTPASAEDVTKMLSSPQGCSRQWIYRQYDQRVGGMTHRDATSPLSVVRLPDSGRALGITLGCRPPIMRMDVLEGAKDAAFFPALELAIKGFEPLALTDCLNFGNPEKPELMTELVASIDGLAEASKALKTPVISGNVSLYNETLDKNVTSTPSTGWVGLRDSLLSIPQSTFQRIGSQVFVVRLPQVEFNGLWAEMQGDAPQFTGSLESASLAKFVGAVKDLALSSEVLSTRLVGRLGLPYAVARMALGDWGLKVEESKDFNFNERLYEIIVEVSESSTIIEKWRKQADVAGLEIYRLGTVAAQTVSWDSEKLSLAQIKTAFEGGWKHVFEELA